MLPNSWAVDAALVNYLAADATLQAALPDGVWFSQAPPGLTRFAVAGILPGGTDENVFEKRAQESTLYLVLVIGLSTAISGPAIDDAAGQLDALLNYQSFPVPGFPGPALVQREGGRVNDTRPEQADASVLWFVRGGQYLVTIPT